MGRNVVEVTIAAEQSVRVIQPAESQAVSVAMPAAQEVCVPIASSQEVAVVIPISQAVNVVCEDSENAVPIILTGPSTVPGLTTCSILWTTDVDAFHRVRLKATLGGDWTEGAWTAGASANASVLLEGLDPEHQDYWYEVQSATDTGAPATFTDWTAGDPIYFYTLCSGVYGMANWNAVKIGAGELSYLRLSWTTTVAMYQAQIDSQTPSLDYGPWGSGDTTHEHNYYGFDFSKAGTYYWRTRNKNRCYALCDYSGWKWFSVNSRGAIYAQG